MTQFLLLSIVRMVVLHYIFFASSRKLFTSAFQRRAFSVVLALLLAAILDGMTPDGWDVEYSLGHPFFFYLFANTPAALIVLIIALLFVDTDRQTHRNENESR